MVLRSRQNRASPADVIRFLVGVKSVITKIVDKSQSAKAERTKAPRYPFFSCLSKVFSHYISLLSNQSHVVARAISG